MAAFDWPDSIYEPYDTTSNNSDNFKIPEPVVLTTFPTDIDYRELPSDLNDGVDSTISKRPSNSIDDIKNMSPTELQLQLAFYKGLSEARWWWNNNDDIMKLMLLTLAQNSARWWYNWPSWWMWMPNLSKEDIINIWKGIIVWAANDIWNNIADGASDIYNKVSQKWRNIANNVSNKIDSASQKWKDFISDVTTKSIDIFNKLKDAIWSLAKATQQKTSDLLNKYL